MWCGYSTSVLAATSSLFCLAISANSRWGIARSPIPLTIFALIVDASSGIRLLNISPLIAFLASVFRAISSLLSWVTIPRCLRTSATWSGNPGFINGMPMSAIVAKN